MRSVRPALSALLCGMVLWAGQALAGGEPERGQALFDLLLSIEEQAGAPEAAIPFPLSALRERITRRGAGAFVKTLIPARSDGTEPGARTGPRILLSGVAGAAPSSDASAEKPRIAGRLFIAYQPADAVLEIISFNDTARRFEFQMVEDYAPGKTPRLRSADREFCVSCHQSGGPLTPTLASLSTTGMQRRGHPSLQAFERRCGACHTGADSGVAEAATPFLAGSWRKQLAGISACAPQIAARLTSTHPPELSGEAWRGSRDFALIQRFARFLATDKAPDTGPCLR